MAFVAFTPIPGVEIDTMIYEHITNFAGKPVKDWEAQSGIQDPEGACYALRLSYEEAAAELLAMVGARTC